MAKSIDVSDLDIYYGDFKAVEGVNMTIRAKAVTAFIGPSGCGKSTFLRALNRMHEVIPGARVEGKVMVSGQSLYDPSVDPVAVRRQIGMVFQRPNPFPTMSIYENVLAGMRLNSKRISKSDADAIVEQSLRGANLWEEVKDRLGKPGMGLSGGQQQRLCIARAIAVSPDVLLMDEPCSALDPISTAAIEDLIHELKTEYTIVIVTHNMQQAARVSDDTGFFNLKAAGQPGHLVEFNPTNKMFTNPDGQPIHPHSLSQTFDRIVRRAPVPVIRLHDLRHTHGSILIANGVHSKVVSERLGHAWYAFTVETYQHVLPGMGEEAARVFESVLTPGYNPKVAKAG